MALAQAESFRGTLTSEDARIFQRLHGDSKFYLESFATIRSEDEGKIPFLFNPIQQHFNEECTGMDLILKPRRLGFSTLLLGKGLHRTISNEGYTAFIMAHTPKSTGYLFKILKIMYESIPDRFKPKAGFDNSNELTFPELDSMISVSAAGSTSGIASNVGRSEQINFLLLSEFAYYAYPEETWTAISQAVPQDSGEIYIESTANGYNSFYDRVRDALTGTDSFKLHFYRWFDEPRYKIPLDRGETLNYSKAEIDLIVKCEEEGTKLTPAQIKWRRWKINQLREIGKFKQEYPESIEEAFLQSDRPWIDPLIVAQRIKEDAREPLSGQLKDAAGRDLHEPIPYEWRLFHHPVRGHRYVISADCAEGLPDGHYDSADVLDVETGEQVCHIHGRLGPYALAKSLNKCGRYYCDANGAPAMLAVEKAVHGAAVLLALRDIEDYPARCIYKHTEFDARTRHKSQKPGWVTSGKEKPIMCDALHQAYSTGEYIVRDKITHMEMRAMKAGSDGLPEKGGSKEQDDCMMSSAIVWRAKAHKPFRQQGW